MGSRGRKERAIRFAQDARDIIDYIETKTEKCTCGGGQRFSLPEDGLRSLWAWLEDVADLRKNAKRGPRNLHLFDDVEARLQAQRDEIEQVRKQKGLRSDDAARRAIAEERGIRFDSLKKAEQRDRSRLRMAKEGHN